MTRGEYVPVRSTPPLRDRPQAQLEAFVPEKAVLFPERHSPMSATVMHTSPTADIPSGESANQFDGISQIEMQKTKAQEQPKTAHSNEAQSVVEQFIAPMRQAQSVLGQITEIARTLADDSLFSSLMTQLSALPSAASFNPLQASRKLPVDIAPVQQEAPQASERHRQFVDALQQKAREKKLADSSKSSEIINRSSQTEVASISTGAQKLSENASQMLSQNGSLSPITPNQGGEQQVSVPGSAVRDSVRATIGSWAALERIAELVQQLESKPASGPSLSQEAPEPKGAPLPLASARAPRPAPGSGPQQEQMAQSQAAMTSTKAAGGKGDDEASGLPTLQRLVEGAWAPGGAVQSVGGASKGQMQSDSAPRSSNVSGGSAEQALSGTAPAPRGASMLNPQLAGSANKPGIGATLSAQVATPNTTSNVGDRGGMSPQNVTVTHDDELAERLNRALIEQAWRGGVDLT